MTTHVVGVKPPDERWQAMKAVWDACAVANTAVPDAVGEFFEWENPDPDGVTVELSAPAVTDYRDDMSEGYSINVRELPPDVTIVRVYNSW